jgi:hypothetical protein
MHHLGMAQSQLSEMGQTFKSKAQQYMNDLTNGDASKTPSSAPTAYREETRQSEMGMLSYFKLASGNKLDLF